MSAHRDSTSSSTYIGRFAPSPSGALHFGSLITALASFLDARCHQGQWLVRMEDIDPPREEAGAQKKILQSLERHGLHWDGEVMHQSQRIAAYEAALAELSQHTYLCRCSRPRLLELNGIYDSHCRQHPIEKTDQYLTSTRIGLDALEPEALATAEHYQDIFQDTQQQHLQQEVGDFILKRKDGLIAYQLAVVVDDIEQNISHIIRGSDLLSSTPRQRYLTLLLKGQIAHYGHLPVASNQLGQKLSKQHKAQPISDDDAFDNLCRALVFLHHPAPVEVTTERHIETLLRWAITHWDRSKIPSVLSVVVED